VQFKPGQQEQKLVHLETILSGFNILNLLEDFMPGNHQVKDFNIHPMV